MLVRRSKVREVADQLLSTLSACPSRNAGCATDFSPRHALFSILLGRLRDYGSGSMTVVESRNTHQVISPEGTFRFSVSGPDVLGTSSATKPLAL